MAIKLVSQADLKVFLGMAASVTDYDALLDDLIERSSAAIERFCDREFENTGTDRSEYFDGGQRIFRLNRWPIDTGSTITLYQDQARSFGSATVIDSGLYAVWDAEGYIEVEYPLFPWPRSVKVVYQGGYTASGGVLPVPDDLAHACTLQAAALFQRTKDLTLTAMPAGDLGSVSAVPMLDPMKLLPGVRDLCEPHRRRGASV